MKLSPPPGNGSALVMGGLRILSVLGMAYAFLSAFSHPLFDMGRFSWAEGTILISCAILYVLDILSHLVPNMRNDPRKTQAVWLGVCVCLLLIIGTKPFIVDKLSIRIPKIVKEGLLLGIASDLFSEVTRIQSST